ncbi:hypothetical protein PENTCL1PPCAC_6307, partial [Pristionchus entomophagus]
ISYQLEWRGRIRARDKKIIPFLRRRRTVESPMTTKVKVGIIGGTGLEDPQILENSRLIDNVDTPYGKISDKMLEGSIQGVPCVILSRHGRQHDINPSNVNYRANLWALAEQGVTVIIASTACGSLQENVKPGDLLFPDSVYDRTFGRQITFFDGEEGHQPGVCHIPMHPLYHEPLRQILISTAKSLKSSVPDLTIHEEGFGVCIEGPRFSTRAESRVFRSWGAAIVNMTMIPEGPLAKELGIPYAPVALITDYDCWKDDAEHVSVELVSATLRANGDKAKRLFIEAIKEIAKKDWTEEVKTLKSSIRASVMLDPSVKIRHLEAGDQ